MLLSLSVSSRPIPPASEFTVMSKGSVAWRPFATGPLIPSAWPLLADGLNLLFSLSPGGQQTGRGPPGRPKVPGGQARPQEANLPHKRFCKSQVATGLTNKILTAITPGTYRNVPSTCAKHPTGLTLFKIALREACSHHPHFTDRQTEAHSPLGKDSKGFSFNRREGCRRELRAQGGHFWGRQPWYPQSMPRLLWVSAPQNQRPKPESSLPLQLVSVDFWTGCYFLDWWQTRLGSIYFEEDENLFPIIFLITERVLEVHTLGFELCCSWDP